MPQINVETQRILFVLLLIALLCAFALIPLHGKDDWGIFYQTAHNILKGISPYVEGGEYYNPPWVAVLLIPVSILPFDWGFALLAVASLVVAVMLAKSYNLGLIKLTAVLLSPAMIYTFLHGQIDMILLGGLLLPAHWWPLVAISKPQVALGLAFGLRKEDILKALVITAIIVILSFLIFGDWINPILNQTGGLPTVGRNLWTGLWPFQVPAGVALILLGYRRKDERFLIAASPFLMPYATSSSLIGLWLVGCTFLKKWETVVVLAFWWLAMLYRYIF